jgi:hypothetical protein
LDGVELRPDDFSTSVFLCMRSMVMGWSWALYFATDAVQQMVSRSCNNMDLKFMFDRNPVPEVASGRPIVGVFVDNICVVGEESSNDVLLVKNNIVAYAKSGKIHVTWSYDVAASVFESVGVVLDLGLKEIRNKPVRLWRFYLASKALVRRRRVRGEHLAIWAGHAVCLL